MTTFDSREEAFESLFAHDEELRFKAVARRAKLLGAWAAGLLHKNSVDAEAYAAELVALVVMNGDEQALFNRVRGDVAPSLASDIAIRDRMSALMGEAVRHVKSA